MKSKRLVAILTILLHSDIVPAPKLAEKFGVSVRTIYRDIQALEDTGIPVVSTTGIRGGISIPAEYRANKRTFNHKDVATLLIDPTYSPHPVLSAPPPLEDINALIHNPQMHAFELDARKLFLDLSPWAGNALVSNNLTAIYYSLRENRFITFQYTTFTQDPIRRMVEPHQLVLTDSQWFLRGYCLAHNAFRVFKLRHIKNIELLPDTFSPRPFPQNTHGLPSRANNRSTRIELLVDPCLKEHLLAKCNEQDMTPLESGKIHVSLDFVENDINYGFLMQCGNKCECIAPKHVRDELIHRLESALKLYCPAAP